MDGSYKEFERKISKEQKALEELRQTAEVKARELQEVQRKIECCEAYLAGMETAFKFLSPPDPKEEEVNLKPGTKIYEIYEVLRRAGRPLNIEDILRNIAASLDTKTRNSISSSLRTYVRRGSIFTNPRRNCYGLKVFPKQSEENESPDTFDIFRDIYDEEEYGVSNRDLYSG